MQQFMVVNKEYNNNSKVYKDEGAYDAPNDSEGNKTNIVNAALQQKKNIKNEGVEFSACLLVKDENHNIPVSRHVLIERKQ